MGSSVGMSQGCARATGKLSIGIIGDSTFLHAGIPGLISAVWNNTNIKLVICDNQATAMTGFQPHPGTGITAMGKQGNKVDIESVVRGVGVKMVETIDPYSVSQSIEAFMRALEFEGPAVVISKRICATEAVRIARRQRVTLKPYRVDPEKCTGCRTCINTFGCPALVYDASKNKVWIDPVLCMGCSVCAQICPFQAISQGE
jgi:indolepyruvate ferredoxin oxidoreductase alpha subunit